ncbi:MAG: hypothetical protein AAB558_03455 [Patescibacteria group bacterium]
MQEKVRLVFERIKVFLTPNKLNLIAFFLLIFLFGVNYHSRSVLAYLAFLPLFLALSISTALIKSLFNTFFKFDDFSIILSLVYFYIVACFIAFSFEKTTRKFGTKKVLVPTIFVFLALLIISGRLTGWFLVFTQPSIGNLSLSAFFVYILTAIVLVFVWVIIESSQLPTFKKNISAVLLFLFLLAAFHPALRGNIIPETLNEEEHDMALLAIDDADSQLDIQGDWILQYEVVSIKTPVEHITPFQGGCSVEVKMQTRTIFGKPFYKIIVYFNSKESLEFCDLEIPNECDFDPHCKP